MTQLARDTRNSRLPKKQHWLRPEHEAILLLLLAAWLNFFRVLI